MFVGLCWFWS